MQLWRRHIFPRLCHAALRSSRVAAYRRDLLAGLTGDILEIGFGTGLNLPHYPPGVRSLVAVDPNPGMHALAAPQLAAAPVEAELLIESAEALPFADRSFDAVVSTWTLCSIPSAEAAMAQVYRVLKPGGAFVFMEHGLSHERGVAWCQRALTPVQRRVADGCHLDRDIEALLAASGLDVTPLERTLLPGMPKIIGYLYRGAALRPGG